MFPAPLSLNPGQRLKALREQLGLSRALFEEKTGINRYTLSSWETNKLPLTPQKAVLLAQIFVSLNIQVSDEYLLTGTGATPTFFQEHSLFLPAFDEEINIHREIDFFKKSHPDCLILKITDEAMAPFFNVSDIVAGYATKQAKNFPLFIGRFCLLETTSQERFLRKVLEVDAQTATVTILNPHTLLTLPTVQKVNIQAIAQVTRHWRLQNRLELTQKIADSF